MKRIEIIAPDSLAFLEADKQKTPYFQLIEQPYGEEASICTGNDPYVLYLLEGSLEIRRKDQDNIIFRSGHCMFLSKNQNVSYRTRSEVHCVLQRFSCRRFSCGRGRFDGFLDYTIEPCDFPVLEIVPIIRGFLDNLLSVKTLLSDAKYQAVKEVELWMLVLNCHSNRQIAWFCQSVISAHDDFRTFVEIHCSHLRSVLQMAEYAGMSQTAFRKKFMDTFGEPPHGWMMKQKAKIMREMVEDGTDNIKAIMDALGYEHRANFQRFCHKCFGTTPAKVIHKILEL